MPSKVFFASARQARLRAEETLPLKLDRVLDGLRLRDRVKNESVAIKMHLGGNVGYSTIHPVFVRRIVEAVQQGGGRPFVTDTNGAVASAHTRGYTRETLGCPLYATGGPDERYFYTHKREFLNLKEFRLGGAIQDATFLIDLAHVKGHPTCGYGGAIKNLALGCMMGPTRGALHDTMHQNRYWDAARCPDEATRKRILNACPLGALVEDRERPEEVHLHVDDCNQCGECLKVSPDGALKIEKENFWPFQEGCAISAKICLDTFDPDKTVFLNVATHMTPVCDCFGFTGMPVLPDLGIVGSNDIVAVEQATLDLIAPFRVVAENLPLSMIAQPGAGHPFQVIHGPLKDPYKAVEYAEALGLGTRECEIVDVMPLEAPARVKHEYVAADEL